MPDATELLSLTNLKSFLTITGSTQDTILQAIKDAIEKRVKTYCGRDFLVTSYTAEYQDGDGGNVVQTDQRPIVTVTSVYSDPARLFEAASLLPSSDMIDDDRNDALGFIEFLTYRFLKGRKATKIVYSAGYSTVPEDLAFAVKLICAKTWKVQSKQLWAEVSQAAGDMTISLNTDEWPKDAKAILDTYRRLTL